MTTRNADARTQALSLHGEFPVSPGSIFRSILWLTLALLVGCSHDPNVCKQKYLESGERYFAKEKYREAIIQFSNALQVEAGQKS